MNKEECLKALECLYDDDVFDREVWGFVREGNNLSCTDVERAKKYYRDKIKDLIEEHFDKNGNVKVIAKIYIDQKELKEIANEAIKECIGYKPYKFKELKKGMWVFDDIYKDLIKCEPGFNKLNQPCAYIDCDDNFNEIYRLFEKGRFYPPNKINEDLKDE